jgi:3-oxoacyl-[acyl-carrier protein] reductase
VACLDLDRAAAERVATEIGANALAIGADVGNAAEVEAAVTATRERFGVPHILVNNAGTTHRNKPLMEVTEEEFDRVFRVNVKSIFHAVRAIAPQMREQGGGVILTVSSTAALRPRPGLTWYNASKGAASLATKSLALELAPWRIRVNALCPVMGATGLLEHFMGVPDTPENRERFIATIPLGRLSEARDIAAAALFLASDEAEFITGIDLPVDGGRTA